MKRVKVSDEVFLKVLSKRSRDNDRRFGLCLEYMMCPRCGGKLSYNVIHSGVACSVFGYYCKKHGLIEERVVWHIYLNNMEKVFEFQDGYSIVQMEKFLSLYYNGKALPKQLDLAFEQEMNNPTTVTVKFLLLNKWRYSSSPPSTNARR